ncbi:MAG: TetR/AcrR family transcriptional regulator [Clostridia bacterium]|nr:TetR/AcrR family transcriptional regulator [Clostridia bacterium]
MEDYTSYETVKEKLITAGIKELQHHGAADFSLRRVAAMCNVSCAAPYKHFKSKEDFIAEILLYINRQWELLENQVAEIFGGDLKKQIAETCIAYVKFRIANPGFNAVLMMKTDGIEERHISGGHMTDYICKLVKELCAENNCTPEETERKIYVIRSFIYGAVIMIDRNQLNNSRDTVAMIKKCIEAELER